MLGEGVLSEGVPALSENQAMKPNLLRCVAMAIRAANQDRVSQEAPCGATILYPQHQGGSTACEGSTEELPARACVE